MSERRRLIIPPEKLSQVRFLANCDDPRDARVVWMAPEHIGSDANIVLRPGDPDVQFINMNFRTVADDPKKSDVYFAEGYPADTRLLNIFAPHVTAFGWDNQAMIDENKRFFGDAIGLYEYIRDKERTYPISGLDYAIRRAYNSATKRHVTMLVPRLRKALHDHPEGIVGVGAGLGHLFFDPSMRDQVPQDQIPQDPSLQILPTIDSDLAETLNGVPIAVFRARDPYWKAEEQLLVASRPQRPRSRQQRF